MRISSHTYPLWSWGFFAFIVIMTVFPKYILFGFCAMLVSLVLGWKYGMLQWKWHRFNGLFVLFYFLYAVGLFYSEDLSWGFRYMEYKLSFVLIPLIFSFEPHKKCSINQLLNWLVAGVLIVFAMGLIKSSVESPTMGWTYFTSTHISRVHHPSYLAWFAYVGFWHLVFGFSQRDRDKLWKIVLLVMLILIQILCFSQAGWLIFSISIMVFLIHKNWKWLLIFVPCMLLGFLYLNELRNKGLRGEPGGEIQQTVYSLMNAWNAPTAYLTNKTGYLTGNEVRIAMWLVTWEAFKENPWGVGTGSLDVVLEKKLVSYGQLDLAKAHYNPHNQFLQTGLELGIIGLFGFLLILYFAVRRAIQLRSKVFLFFLLGFFIHCLFESVLQRQSGLIFFTFWVCVLWTPIFEKNQAYSEPNSTRL